jgi:hypothetical protein
MKHVFKIAIVFSGMLFASCDIAGQLSQADDARAFNDSIVGQQSKIVRCILDMSGAYEADIAMAEQYRKEGVSVAGQGIRKVEGMKAASDEQLGFKNASLQLFRFYKELLAKESREIITILGKDSIDQVDLDRITAIENSITSRETKLDSLFEKAQEAFAKKHGVMLLNNPLQNEIDSIK